MTRKELYLFTGVFIVILALFSCNKKDSLTNLNSDSINFVSQKKLNQSKQLDLTYSSQQLDNTNGLSNSSVNTIFQDSENLLWIGTWDGLNRYDGNSFKIFRPELGIEKSLNNQVVLKIDEDNKGFLWILTMNGINSYDKKANTFQRYYFPNTNKFTLSENEFNLTVNNAKQVFCAVKGWGIGFFNGNEFEKIEIKNLPKNTVKKMVFTPSGKLLILLINGELFSINFKSKIPDKKTVLKAQRLSDKVESFGVYKNQKVCIITSSGNVIIRSLLNKEVNKVFNGEKHQKIIGHTSEGFIISGKKGCFVLNDSGDKLIPNWLKGRNNQEFTTLIKGKEDVIWAGTDGDGLLKMYPLKKSFNVVSKVKVPQLDKSIVRTFLEVDKKYFFVGTKGKGLFRFPLKFDKGLDNDFPYQYFDESNSSINNSVYSLYKGQDELVFIGTDGNGLHIFDIKKEKLIDWNEILGNELYEDFKSVYSIFQDEDGFIWLGTNGYGMVRFKVERIKDKLKISHFKAYLAGNEKALSSNIIFSIVPKSKNELWIGTRLGGLNVFNKKTESFKAFKNSENDTESLSSNDILCLHTDASKRLWIGTSLGLNLLEDVNNDINPKFKRFTVNDGLPNNTIHGIISDKNANLWISTNFGLSNYISNDSKFINYTKNEGLQNNEFADGALYQSPYSDLVFAGGIKGFNYFSPSKVEESQVVPDILIDKISGQNKKAPYYQGLVISPNAKTFPSITLKHNQNFFDIELSALTFINSEKCKYAYRLDNFDKDWNIIGNRRNISFTNVPKGNYSLWLKWSNSDGVWSNAVHAIDIKIMPVFWQSDLAIFIYVALVLLFLLFVWSYYNKQHRLRQNIIFQKQEEETHQNRLTFFTNIAHEFQTPLTLIVGPIQKLAESENLDQKSKKFIRMIQRNSSRLLFLTQQLLEFRKAEYDYLEVSVKQFDLVNLVEQIAELFDELAFDNNIEFKLSIPTELNGWYDKDKIEKIIFNLLSNAFKYTQKNGSIKLEFAIKEDAIKTLTIKTSNTGKGISKEKLESLFDRFFLTDTVHDSEANLYRTGIGLAYIKKLIIALRGEISVSSQPNKRTDFTVSIPCSEESFKDHEFETQESQTLISSHLKNILEEAQNTSEESLNKMSSLEAFLEKRKEILIVEDEKEIQFFLTELLKEKYKIIIANNGLEALKKIESKIPDIIITDIMMPEMDGIEFCKKIKNNNKTFHIPLIMLTAKSSISHQIEGLESGANAYIPKPFHPDHILVRVQKLLEEREFMFKHLAKDTFLDNIKNLQVHNDDKELLRNVVELIRNNIENSNLQSLFIEENLGISNSQLYRKVKQNFGFSTGDLIRTIRLTYAAELLRKSNCTVSEVCYKSGFNNRSYFYREFKKMYNNTPKDYQLKNKTTIE